MKKLVALHRAALKAVGDSKPFVSDIRLEIEVHCLKSLGRIAGDLDNFVTGICDGLMAADRKIKKDSKWASAELQEIRPDRTIAIVDDSKVIEIVARKIFEDSGANWYRVSIEGKAQEGGQVV